MVLYLLPRCRAFRSAPNIGNASFRRATGSAQPYEPQSEADGVIIVMELFAFSTKATRVVALESGEKKGSISIGERDLTLAYVVWYLYNQAKQLNVA
jgi:hypothetical protein